MLLNVARQEPQKGQHYLLDAFDTISREWPDSILLVAGREGSSTPELRARMESLGLDEHVRFLGTRADVPDLLCAADVFVFSSLWEGLGGAVLEAMAMGVPVVSFAVPAVEEALATTGVLVPVGDAPALARAISQVLDDPLRRERLAHEARERFDRKFTISACLEGMRKFYEETTQEAAMENRTLWQRLRRGRK